MINVAVCDDEPAEIAYITNLITKWSKAQSVYVRITDFESAESFMFAYENEKSIDIMLLDIQMKNMNGIELARKIRCDNDNIQIIFITGYPDFIADGYDVSALHYLMKPVNEDKLFAVLDKAVERLKKAEQTLLINTTNGTERVLIDEIMFIEAFAHYVSIKTKKTTFETRANIGEIEKSLGNAFVRCHRSYIVGLNYINRVTKTEIVLDNGNLIPLSRRLYAEINRAFINFYRGDR